MFGQLKKNEAVCNALPVDVLR